MFAYRCTALQLLQHYSFMNGKGILKNGTPALNPCLSTQGEENQKKKKTFNSIWTFHKHTIVSSGVSNLTHILWCSIQVITLNHTDTLPFRRMVVMVILFYIPIAMVRKSVWRVLILGNIWKLLMIIKCLIMASSGSAGLAARAVGRVLAFTGCSATG